jgi:hypothetical protein
MGRFSDDAGAVVYLAAGDQTVLVHAGDRLVQGYRVVALDARHIEFEHLASGSRQTLTLPDPESPQ